MNIESVAVLIGTLFVTITVLYVMYKINQESKTY